MGARRLIGGKSGLFQTGTEPWAIETFARVAKYLSGPIVAQEKMVAIQDDVGTQGLTLTQDEVVEKVLKLDQAMPRVLVCMLGQHLPIVPLQHPECSRPRLG